MAAQIPLNTDVSDVLSPLHYLLYFTTGRMLIGGTRLISSAIITQSALLQKKKLKKQKIKRDWVTCLFLSLAVINERLDGLSGTLIS